MFHHTVCPFAGSSPLPSSEGKCMSIYAFTKTVIQRETELPFRWISVRHWCSLWIRFKIRQRASGLRNVSHLRKYHRSISITLVMVYTWRFGKCSTNSWFSTSVGFLCNTMTMKSRPLRWRDSNFSRKNSIFSANTYPSWTIAYQDCLKNVPVSPATIIWTSSASYGALAVTPSTFASGWTKNTTPSLGLLFSTRVCNLHLFVELRKSIKMLW